MQINTEKKYGKCDLEFEEPSSKLMYYISYLITKKININPNLITTARLVIMFIVYYLLYKNYKILAGLLYLLCFFFDHLDGEMSRQHNTNSLFGDYYDHFVDIFYELPVFLFLYYKYIYDKSFYLYLIIFFIILINSTILVFFQEEKINENNSKVKSSILGTLNFFKNYNCKNISILKYFGQGLLHLFVFYLIIL